MTHWKLALLVSALWIAAAACGDDTSDDEAANNAANNTGNNTGNNTANNGQNNDIGACAECSAAQICVDEVCQDPVIPEPGADVNTDPVAGCAATSVSFVSGYVVDSARRPVAGAKAQVCLRTSPGDTLLCLMPADTESTGGFGVVIPDNARCVDDVTMRVLLPGASKVTSYCHVKLGTETVLNVENPVVLFDTTPAVTLPEFGDGNMARTVVFADGLELEVTPLSFFGNYDALAVTRIDPATPGLCFLESPDQVDALYAFSPEDNIDGTFPVKIPNDDGLAPGTTVDMFALGGLECVRSNGENIGEGDFELYGTATVDEAGEFIVSNEDGHLPCLNWFGYKAR